MGCFNHCFTCVGGEIAESDGHNRCLLCLGEGHVVKTFSFCSQFSKQTRQNRATRSQYHLMKSALNPLMQPIQMKDAAREAVLVLKILSTKSQFQADIDSGTENISIDNIDGFNSQRTRLAVLPEFPTSTTPTQSQTAETKVS